MKDRLQQIWSGFSERTTLDLSGTSVKNTLRPGFERNMEREAHKLEHSLEQPLRVVEWPEGTTDPVGAALTALHSSVEQQSKQRGRKKRMQADLPVASFASEESGLEKTLFADIAFTRSKTSRRDGDYLTYAAARQDAWQRRKRKKFLGIF